MKKSFSSVLSIFLMFVIFAVGSLPAFAITKGEFIEQRRRGETPGTSQGTRAPRMNLDTGEMTPEPVDYLLQQYSYVLPYLPKGTKRVHKTAESGPCTQEGVVYKDAISSRGCYIFSSPDASIFKIQIKSQSSSFNYMPRIWKKVDGNWVLWAEFDTGGKATYASTEAARFAGRSVPSKAEDKPQYADTPPATPAEIPHVPSLGTILDGIIRKSR